METPKYSQVIDCHQGLQTNGICFHPQCNGVPVCMDCLLTKHADHIKHIDSISAIAEKAADHYDLMNKIRSNEEAPTKLKELIDTKDERRSELVDHIDKEKSSLQKIIKDLQQSFLAITNKVQETISTALDAQLGILDMYFRYFESKYDRFYRDEEDRLPEFPPISEVMGRLNNITDKENLEAMIKRLHTDIKFGKSWSGTLEQKLMETERGIMNISQLLREVVKLKPSTKLIEQIKDQTNNLLKEINNSLESNKNHLLSNEIITVNESATETTMIMTMESKLITTILDRAFINAWLPQKVKSFTLLYRGSIDGFRSSAFHKKVDNNCTTLTVVESTQGKIFGGYSDKLWKAIDNPTKPSQDTFLFSVTDKEFYPVKETSKSTAIYSHAEWGPIFGTWDWGHDLCIADSCDRSKKSISDFGRSYESKGKTSENFVGEKREFNVKEIEVFGIKFI
jgi:hypothetical protein